MLLGSSNDNRINIKKSMEQSFHQINIIVPEKDFPENYYYSIIKFEEFLFCKREINLIFINISSPGSSFEYGYFYNFTKISKKLILCIYHKYHHLYSSSSSMLTNTYTYYDIKYGHVYPIKNEDEKDNFKTFQELIKFFILYLQNY